MLRVDDGIWVGLFYIFPEILPELVIEIGGQTQISRHVQTPAVHVIRRRNPFPGNAHDIIVKLLRGLIA